LHDRDQRNILEIDVMLIVMNECVNKGLLCFQYRALDGDHLHKM